ncbi:MAG: molybdopterin-dependent oxidoreductase [Crocinitomicaceae bacterium]|jgi:methionine sulfoxide reductase catalytic subunit|nr:molybdopterin-dependent oxidoreductase [Crocinitomicaceae bacterium]
MRTLGKITRRLFLERGLWATALIFWSWCRGSSNAEELHTYKGTDYIGKTREGEYKNFYINFWKPMRRINGETWELKITGLCDTPQSFTLENFKSFTTTTQSSRMKCVECWSARAQWSGFSIHELEQIVQPKPEAKGILFHCGDEYKEYLPRTALNQDQVILAHSMNGKPLTDAHGFPLRLIAPSKYGYKNPKAILEMEYVSEHQAGTWSKIGPYSQDGTILPGTDHPLEFGKEPRRISGGEITDY